MLSTLDIRKAVVNTLKSKYSYKIYGREVIEGFERPSFFVDIVSQFNYITTNIQYVQTTITITYFQKQFNALDNEKVFDELKNLFGMKINVLDRKLTIMNPRIEYTGENMEIMQYVFDLNYYDEIIKPVENYDLMQELNINEGVNS